MAIDPDALFNALTSMASESGFFDSVTGHEPKAAPSPTGASCSVWFNDMRTVQSSGLSSASVRVEFTMCVYTSMLQEPQDAIDPRVMKAAGSLFSALVGEFQLSLGDCRYVDVFGSDGEQLRAPAGYMDQDGKKFRVITVMVPIVLNDAYTESA